MRQMTAVMMTFTLPLFNVTHPTVGRRRVQVFVSRPAVVWTEEDYQEGEAEDGDEGRHHKALLIVPTAIGVVPSRNQVACGDEEWAVRHNRDGACHV